MLLQHAYHFKQVSTAYGPQTGPPSKGTRQQNTAEPLRPGLHRQNERRSRIPFVLFAVLALLAAVLGFDEVTSASHPDLTTFAAVEANTHGTTASVDILDDIIALLEQMLEDLADAEALIGTGTEPLQEPTKTAVANLLDNAEALIDQILDSNEYPSLTPADAGSIDPSFAPTTLPEYATDSNDLAVDALQEAQSRIVDDGIIGTDLKTIKSLLPGYRQEAGI